MKKDDLNKYISKLMNMDEKKLYGVLAGILVLIFLADYFIIMRPQLNALSSINADMEVKRQEIRKTKENIEKLEQYQQQVDALQKTLDEMNASVKPIDEISRILEQISNIADDQGVKLDQLNPNPREQELILENNKVAYYAFPILIEGRTKYHDFGRFLNALENADLCLRIKDMSISSMDRSVYHAVTLSMNAIVFQEKIASGE